ncbi:MAG: hypothetical protein NTV28_17175 [Propionibacteriales bacterium]|nr:hypothetical protein [Propionibacteriales bacterium]
MSGYWSVDPGALITASYDWRDHADTLEGLSRRLRSADVSGFPPGVSGAATTFRQQWAGMVDSLEATSRDFESRMLDAHAAYVDSDVRSQEAFQEWLLQMGEGER